MTTANGSESGPYNGGTFSQTGYDGTLTIDSANGGESDTNGTVKDNGNGRDNGVAVDGGTESHQYPLGATGSHNDSSSVDDTDLSYANGPFTTSGGAIATEDVNYGDADTKKSQGSYSDTTTSSNGQGGTTTSTDSSEGTDKATDNDKR